MTKTHKKAKAKTRTKTKTNTKIFTCVGGGIAGGEVEGIERKKLFEIVPFYKVKHKDKRLFYFV